MKNLECLQKPTADVYKVLLDNSPGKVVIKDTKDKIVWCNARALKMFGQNKLKDVIGHSPSEYWPADSNINGQFFKMDKEVMANGASKLTTSQFMEWVDGKDHLIRIDKIPYRNSKGAVAGVVTFIIDMTEALETHILKYNSDIIYHELRAGLTNIISIIKNHEGDGQHRRLTD